jgi:predicted ribosome quality control (RQC) complex YloA/Tae2 family protein
MPEEFDVSAALSQRDKKISELISKLEESEKTRAHLETRHGELEMRFKDVEAFYKAQQQESDQRKKAGEWELTDDDLKDGYLTESGAAKVARREQQSVLEQTQQMIAESGEKVSPAMQKLIEGLSAKIDNLQNQTIDTSLGLSARYQDEDFKKWANETRYSQFDPDSPTLAQRFDELVKKGDMRGMRSILDAYDRQNRGTTSSTMPDVRSKQLSPEQKKIGEKIKEVEAEIKLALKQRDFRKGKELNSRLDELYKQMR